MNKIQKPTGIINAVAAFNEFIIAFRNPNWFKRPTKYKTAKAPNIIKERGVVKYPKAKQMPINQGAYLKRFSSKLLMEIEIPRNQKKIAIVSMRPLCELLVKIASDKMSKASTKCNFFLLWKNKCCTNAIQSKPKNQAISRNVISLSPKSAIGIDDMAKYTGPYTYTCREESKIGGAAVSSKKLPELKLCAILAKTTSSNQGIGEMEREIKETIEKTIKSPMINLVSELR